jgi:hypothetical protein
MKTRNLILTLAIGLGVFTSSNVFAIDPISFSTDKAVSKTEMIVEKDIKVQDWMVEAEVFGTSNATSGEKSLNVENWMIEGSWNMKEHANVPEAGLKVEGWMLKSFDSGSENVE